MKYTKAELLELMEDTSNYFFKVSDRTNGFLYILDGNGSRVLRLSATNETFVK